MTARLTYRRILLPAVFALLLLLFLLPGRASGAPEMHTSNPQMVAFTHRSDGSVDEEQDDYFLLADDVIVLRQKDGQRQSDISRSCHCDVHISLPFRPGSPIRTPRQPFPPSLLWRSAWKKTPWWKTTGSRCSGICC